MSDLLSEETRPKQCGHHGTVLTKIEGEGFRCPWCFPQFFPEHRAPVALGEAVRVVEMFGLHVSDDAAVARVAALEAAIGLVMEYDDPDVSHGSILRENLATAVAPSTPAPTEETNRG